jgi:hypothetical protein
MRVLFLLVVIFSTVISSYSFVHHLDKLKEWIIQGIVICIKRQLSVLSSRHKK